MANVDESPGGGLRSTHEKCMVLRSAMSLFPQGSSPSMTRYWLHPARP